MPKFVHTEGLITVAEISSPAWLVRKRNSDRNQTTPFIWNLVLTTLPSGVCSVEGHLANQPMTRDDYRTLQRIIGRLGFNEAIYERYNEAGKLSKVMRPVIIKPAGIDEGWGSNSAES